MPTKIGFGKLERVKISNDRLPPAVRIAMIDFKHQIRGGSPMPEEFLNKERGLPSLAAGQKYLEYQAGNARVPTPADPNARGSHRLVALVNASNQVLTMFFTLAHYAPGQWMEIQFP